MFQYATDSYNRQISQGDDDDDDIDDEQSYESSSGSSSSGSSDNSSSSSYSEDDSDDDDNGEMVESGFINHDYFEDERIYDNDDYNPRTYMDENDTSYDNDKYNKSQKYEMTNISNTSINSQTTTTTKKKSSSPRISTFDDLEQRIMRPVKNWKGIFSVAVIVVSIGSTLNLKLEDYMPSAVSINGSRRNNAATLDPSQYRNFPRQYHQQLQNHFEQQQQPQQPPTYPNFNTQQQPHAPSFPNQMQQQQQQQQSFQNQHQSNIPHFIPHNPDEHHLDQYERFFLRKKMDISRMSEKEYAEWSGVAQTQDQVANAPRGGIWDWVPPEAEDEGEDGDATEEETEGEESGGGESEGTGDGADPYDMSQYKGKDVSSIVLPWKPPELDGYKDVWDPLEAGDNPVYWHIPKAGGSSIKNTLGSCHRFRMATEAGIRNGHDQDTTIAIVYPQKVEGQDSTPFVNCDPTNLDGIKRCKELGLAESGLAEVIVTPYFHESNVMFPPTHRGRLFTIFRDPIERAVSMFYYLQVADWETTYNADLKKMTLEEFAKSNLVEDNWMVRRLTGAIRGKLTDDHLAEAMRVINKKFLVGLLSKSHESMERFEKFFRWKFRVNPPNQEKCRIRLMAKGANTGTNKKDVTSALTGDAHRVLSYRNRLDIQLYKFIEDLFDKQKNFVNHLPDEYRLNDASCAKCVPPTFPVCEDHMGECLN